MHLWVYQCPIHGILPIYSIQLFIIKCSKLISSSTKQQTNAPLNRSSNYMRSIGIDTGFELNNNLPQNNNTNNADTNNNNENVPNNNNINNQPANNADADLRPDERENDWLSLLNNLCSFFVLFSFVYFYSTFVRFMIVFLAVVLLIL